jgi:selenocysteine-specific elongation factor
MTVIATAGHVDHGKSTLIRLLTGTDPDRWEEEKARGLTIDLGFASLTLPSGRDLSFIDVPGHVRFLRNMLAGVGAVQGCLFVVAATEGWKPQTEEHLRILDLLGVRHGVVALTKVDQVDTELLELAMLDVAEHVEGSFLDTAPIVSVAAPDRSGYDRLVAELDALVDRVGPPTDSGRPRLWIDRSFAPTGAGTVVTGTLTGGAIRLGDEVLLAPQGQLARVRGLQTHHRGVEVARPGTRLAVNLTGVSHHEIGRGDVLVMRGAWHHSRTVDARLKVLDSLDHEVSRRGAYAAYIGSGESNAAVRILGLEALAPGTTGLVRLHLDRPLPLTPGDRFILREHGRDETIGGGELLDVEPVLPAARARPDRRIERVVAERGWVDAGHLARITGSETHATVGRWVVDPAVLDAALTTLRADIDAAGALGLDVAALDERRRSLLPLIDEAKVDAGRVVLGQPVDPLAGHPWLEALMAQPFAPPGPEGIDRREVNELVRRGLVIEHEGIYFAADALAMAGRRLAAAFSQSPDGLTVAEIRDLWGTSRKFVLAILAHFDRTGQTRRRDDLRFPGPRLPNS